MKRIFSLIILVAMLLTLLAGCGGEKGKMVNCDHCGTPLTLPLDSPIDNEDLYFCEKCQKKLGVNEFGESVG